MVDVNTQTCTPQGRDGASCKSTRLDAYLGVRRQAQRQLPVLCPGVPGGAQGVTCPSLRKVKEVSCPPSVRLPPK